MATSSGGAAGDGRLGRLIGRARAAAGLEGGPQTEAEDRSGATDGIPTAGDQPGEPERAGGNGASPAAPPDGSGPGPTGRRPALDSLASHRRPRAVPPPPGGLLPTTRRGMLRYRVLPRSVVGISLLILAFAIGSGFSGVVLYSYYQYREGQTDAKVNALISGYKGQFAKAQSDLNAAVAAAKANIDTQLKAAQALQAGPAQLATIIKDIAPSVFFVHTLDSAGQPSVGTAFVVSSNNGQTLLITSYSTVSAATRSPGPQVLVSQGANGAQTPVTVRSWDQSYDLALLVLDRAGLTPITPAPSSPPPQPGDRLFAVSGLGSAGASLTQGSVIDVSTSGLEVDTAIGTAFQGGPVVNQAGQVVAIASRNYAPLGFTSQGTYFIPYVESACAKVLTCPGGTLPGSQ